MLLWASAEAGMARRRTARRSGACARMGASEVKRLRERLVDALVDALEVGPGSRRQPDHCAAPQRPQPVVGGIGVSGIEHVEPHRATVEDLAVPRPGVEYAPGAVIASEARPPRK